MVVSYSRVVYCLKKGLLIYCMTECSINGEGFVLCLLHFCTYACNRFLLLLLEKVICLVLSSPPVRKMVTG